MTSRSKEVVIGDDSERVVRNSAKELMHWFQVALRATPEFRDALYKGLSEVWWTDMDFSLSDCVEFDRGRKHYRVIRGDEESLVIMVLGEAKAVINRPIIEECILELGVSPTISYWNKGLGDEPNRHVNRIKNTEEAVEGVNRMLAWLGRP